jgi:hypothetical protein
MLLPGFDPWPGHVGYMVDKVALGGFLQVLGLPLPFLIPPTASHSLIILSSMV